MLNRVRMARFVAGDETQKTAADRLGVHWMTFGGWERQDNMPDNMYTLYLAVTGQHPDIRGVRISIQQNATKFSGEGIENELATENHI